MSTALIPIKEDSAESRGKARDAADGVQRARPAAVTTAHALEAVGHSRWTVCAAGRSTLAAQGDSVNRAGPRWHAARLGQRLSA